jgi:formylglycine-generating enzyme required for sulfatase activity
MLLANPAAQLIDFLNFSPMNPRFVLTVLFLGLGSLRAFATLPVALWNFDNAADRNAAAIGSPLTRTGTGFVDVAGINGSDGAVSVGPGSHFRAPNPIGANGGGSFTNQYTLVWDVFTPSASSGKWMTLLQTNTSNTNDGDLFIRNSDRAIGTTAGLGGYTSNTLPLSQWKRVVLRVDTTVSNGATIWVDGTLWRTATASGGRDGRYSLDRTVLLFADDDGDDQLIHVSNLALYGGLLNNAQIAQLGGAGASFDLTNTPPSITQGSETMIEADLNGPAVTLQLNATDAQGDAITWSIPSQPSNATAALSPTSGTATTINFTPAAGFAGTTSFRVRAADAGGFSEILVNALVRDPNALPFPTPLGLWEFDFPVDPGVATIGSNLTLTGTGFSSASGIAPADGAAVVNPGSHFRMNHGIAPGTGGGSRINEYTLMFDVRYPSSSVWKTLYQANPANNDDGEVFIRPTNGDVGVGDLGYSSNATSPNTWYRIVVAVDNGTSRRIYVNGTLWNSGNAGSLDDRFALHPETLILGDEDGEDGQILISNLAVWGQPLTATEITGLGLPGIRVSNAPPPTPNHPPAITQGEALTIQVGTNTTANFLLDATDINDDTLTWSISRQPTFGSAQIVSSASSSAGVSFTPAANFTGTVNFDVRVSDGRFTDTITVTAVVSNDPPVIAEGESYLLNVTKDSPVVSTPFSATDAQNNALQWTITTAPLHGTAEIPEPNGNNILLGYQPDAGYAGFDTVVLAVSDGTLSDSITINIAVNDPAAQPTLTIVSPFASTTPAPGAYQHPRGTVLENSATDITGSDTRHTCIGWEMVGDAPSEGNTASFEMTLTRNSVLTWKWRTEYLMAFATDGQGSITAANGWFDASRPLMVTATPEPGHYFAGWTGDTAECLTGGNTITIPMDRPRTTITARFLPEETFSVVVLPDTQNYTSISSPTDLFDRQTQWVIDNIQPRNIKFLTHVGDIVNNPGSSSEWNRATAGMNILHNGGISPNTVPSNANPSSYGAVKVPYSIVVGNHDIANGNTFFLNRFGPSHPRWIDPQTGQRYDWLRGFSPRGYSSYQVLEINGREMLFLSVDIDTPEADLQWAEDVLAAHPRALTLLTTHNYLAETGGGGSAGTGNGLRGRVTTSYVPGIAPTRTSGEVIFQRLVRPFNQVYMVVCGHNFAQYNLLETNAYGKPVHELLIDYQTLPNGGNAFLRTLEFRPATTTPVQVSYSARSPGQPRITASTTKGTIHTSAFSPYLNRFLDQNLYAADRQGMLDLNDRDANNYSIEFDAAGRFDQTLTIASAFGTPTPAVGTHGYAAGTPVAASVDPVVSGNTRRRPTGWSLTRSSGPVESGSGSSAIVTLEEDSLLTWNWSTEYRLETGTLGQGAISVNSGWQPADANVVIQAQPDFGASFIAWTGDIDGCAINGTQITVPMNRPRGPVKAEFSSSNPVYQVVVISARPTVSPGVATYSYEEGSFVTFTASDDLGPDTRHLCTGYTVSGATSTSGSGTSVTVEINGNTQITWHWLTQHRLFTASNGPGTVAPSGESWINQGSPVAINATPSGGAEFNGWAGNTDGAEINGPSLTFPAFNAPVVNLTATFTSSQLALTVASDYPGSAYPPGVHYVDFGTTITATMPENISGRTRRVAASWETNIPAIPGGSGDTASFIITEDTTLTWNWETYHLFEIAGGAEGIVRPMNAGGWIKENQNASAQAVGAPHFDFAAWQSVSGGTASANPQLVLPMNSPARLLPDFTPRRAARGTPHAWLLQNTTMTGTDFATAESTDHDGDGQDAATEFSAGTSDRDPASRFQASFQLEGDQMIVRIPQQIHRTYSLFGTQTLVRPFDLLSTFAVHGGQGAGQLEFGPSKPQYYRYMVEAAAALTPPPFPDLDPDAPALSFAAPPHALRRDMVFIPAGAITMGDTTGGNNIAVPTREVEIAAFFMDKYEVTTADWRGVATWAAANGYDIPLTPPYLVPDDHPAVGVSWYDAVKWCNARSEMEGRVPAYYTDANGTAVYRTGVLALTSAQVNWHGNGYRLPTEAEWEKAARGGLANQNYPWPNELNHIVRANTWFYLGLPGVDRQNESYPITTRVGFFDGTQPGGGGDVANGYGLYDMAGNAWEWTWDRENTYSPVKQFHPRGPDTGDTRVLRGGSWWTNDVEARVSQRLPFTPDAGVDPYGVNGLRPIRAAHPNEVPAP